MSECPFTVGQTIKHKASGEKAIVKKIRERCVKHTMVEHAQISVLNTLGKPHNYGECEMVFSGWVDISLDIKGTTKCVKSDEFEAA